MSNYERAGTIDRLYDTESALIEEEDKEAYTVYFTLPTCR